MVVQQNRKSPSTVLTAHNGTGNRTFMCNMQELQKIRLQGLLWGFVNLALYHLEMTFHQELEQMPGGARIPPAGAIS